MPDLRPFEYTPANDLGLPPRERMKSVRRESGLLATLFHATWWAGVRTYMCIAHRLSIEGREHLPKSLPFVMVGNHTSHLDALIMAAPLPLRLRDHIFPVAAGDTFFQTPAIGAFAALCLNALPLWRKRAGSHALADLRTRLLEEPCGYVLFPEGTRARDGKLGEFKPGLGMLVAGTNVPVIPCHLSGAYEAMPPHANIPRWKKISMQVGSALTFEHEPDAREGWERTAIATREAVARLSQPALH